MMVKKVLENIVSFAVIPAVLLCGAFFFGEKAYAYVSVIMAVIVCLLFYVIYEKRGRTRKLVIVAVMTALAVAGRFVFGFLPAFKPVTAITVITAMYLGSTAGFLTGSFSALISNFWFGQGPWTPFQMFSWGIIGFIAGLLGKPLQRSKIFLIIYGVFSGILYSVIMDFWSVLWYNADFSPILYGAALLASLPHTTVYALSNVVFLLLMNKPFGRKLSRLNS